MFGTPFESARSRVWQSSSVSCTATYNQSQSIKPDHWGELLDIVYVLVQAGTERPKSEEVISPLHPWFTIHFAQRSLKLMVRLAQLRFVMLLYLSIACPNLLKMSCRDQWLHESLCNPTPHTGLQCDWTTCTHGTLQVRSSNSKQYTNT